MKTTVHIIPHAHWDREWYMPLELHRARLVTQLDNVLDLLETYPGYTYHLDGQMIALEDYLMLRPEKEEMIRKYVSEGRLQAGPWYVLQDEYLTSGEANVRNLLCGMNMAQQFGKICRIGYLPDAFGNVGQMPQIFSQAGLTASVFGRGVSLSAESPDPAGHFPRYSEFIWKGPDESVIPAVFFAGWYNNAQEIPVDSKKAKDYWDERLAHARKFSSSEHLLFLNGADHQPVQKDLPSAIETARKLYPDIDFIYSDFEKYVKCVFQSRKTQSEIVSGELAGQESNGTNTLCNTASTHVPIKVLNRRNESLLSLTVEPLLSMAALAGMKIDSALLHRSWKLLMQNHPHDSICGCSIDQVNREIVGRFEKSIQLGEYLAGQAEAFLAGKIQAPGLNDAETSFVIFNPSGWTSSHVITVTVGVNREYGSKGTRQKVERTKADEYCLLNSDGKEVPAITETLGIQFGFELPDDTFRKPYFERKIRITFSAQEIPSFGYAVYYLKKKEKKHLQQDSKNSENFHKDHMENPFLSVDIHSNGTYDVTDKITGRIYRSLGIYEDTGDVGDEYIFRETIDGVITSENANAEVICLENSGDRTIFKIDHLLHLPNSADIALNEASVNMIRRFDRYIKRSSITTAFPITTYLTMEKDSPLLKIKTEFNNTVKDHRLRILFPTDLSTDTHLADSVFDVIERPDVPGKKWTNPSRCQRMRYFAAVEDEKGGLAVINRGLYEYEILPERKKIAVTLLRCVGELGDWGVFPTPAAQCPGPLTIELALLPYVGRSFRENGCKQAVQFQTDMNVFQIRNSDGILPERGSFLNCSGKGLCFTALKPSEDARGLILRVCNVTEEPSELDLIVPNGYKCYKSDIIETKLELIQTGKDGHVFIPVGKKEIKTLRIENCHYE